MIVEDGTDGDRGRQGTRDDCGRQGTSDDSGRQGTNTEGKEFHPVTMVTAVQSA